jgi:hypothetical protein
MIIRRDAMARLPPAAQAQAMAAYARYAASQSASASPQSHSSPLSNNPSPHITTTTIEKIAAASGMGGGFTGSPNSKVMQLAMLQMQGQGQAGEGGQNGYALNPLQQREQMQRETWERERKALLKKASNSQGDSVERLLANYLAV